jgi:hypothetical protein
MGSMHIERFPKKKKKLLKFKEKQENKRNGKTISIGTSYS